jgi:hypothetical protein
MVSGKRGWEKRPSPYQERFFLSSLTLKAHSTWPALANGFARPMERADTTYVHTVEQSTLCNKPVVEVGAVRL